MDDLISRTMAIDALRYAELGCELEAIETLPSAERKKGRWIRHILKNANVPWGFDCSACGVWFVIGEDTAERYKYCPNCGADMRGEQDE